MILQLGQGPGGKFVSVPLSIGLSSMSHGVIPAPFYWSNKLQGPSRFKVEGHNPTRLRMGVQGQEDLLAALTAESLLQNCGYAMPWRAGLYPKACGVTTKGVLA